MKTRNGFVSNSSSSSFIIAFENKPENVDDVIDELFYCLENESITQKNIAKVIAERIFNDISSGDKEIGKDYATSLICEELSDLDTLFRISDLKDEGKNEDAERLKFASDERNEIRSKIILNNMLKENNILYCVKYDDYSDSFMEHEAFDIFIDCSSYYRISHH